MAILDANQNTDWSKVSIARLQNHLVDMNPLTLKANVEVNEMPAMVPAHANELNKMSSRLANTQTLPNGARLSMTSNDKEVVQKINALGFFGLMATGAHHQPHHLEMAKGTMVH